MVFLRTQWIRQIYAEENLSRLLALESAVAVIEQTI